MMADHSKIEWTDATWNPVTGCTLVSDGCRNCYAAELAAGRLKGHPSRAGLARRNAAGVAAFTGEVRFNEQWLDQPLRWRKPRRIFVCAHSDLFHEDVPEEWIDRVFAVMALCPQHTFQVLTKRPERMRSYIEQGESDDGYQLERWSDAAVRITGSPCAAHIEDVDWPLPNVWLGVSAEDQATADARIPHLLDTPAAVRFVSAEPLLRAVDVSRFMWPVCARWPAGYVSPEAALAAGAEVTYHKQALVWAHARFLDWVIVGGESGRGARGMHPDWVRTLRDQCQAAGVAFFFKQWGEWAPAMANTGRDGNGLMSRVGKKHAGRLLDGREWSEMPAGEIR